VQVPQANRREAQQAPQAEREHDRLAELARPLRTLALGSCGAGSGSAVEVGVAVGSGWTCPVTSNCSWVSNCGGLKRLSVVSAPSET
jgi:hypothetical protein